MRAALEGQLSSAWQRFQDVTAVLVAAGALAANNLQVRIRPKMVASAGSILHACLAVQGHRCLVGGAYGQLLLF